MRAEVDDCGLRCCRSRSLGRWEVVHFPNRPSAKFALSVADPCLVAPPASSRLWPGVPSPSTAAPGTLHRLGPLERPNLQSASPNAAFFLFLRHDLSTDAITSITLHLHTSQSEVGCCEKHNSWSLSLNVMCSRLLPSKRRPNSHEGHFVPQHIQSHPPSRLTALVDDLVRLLMAVC